MALYYAMSDIHGHYNEFSKALETINLTNATNKLFLLGDYVDNGDKSYQVLEKIMELEASYPNQVIVLLGNHDEWFYDWLISETPTSEVFVETIKSFFRLDELKEILSANPSNFESAIRQEIKTNPRFSTFISWFKEKHKEPRFIETENQIFVHAGIDEEAKDFWQIATSSETFTNKFPYSTGKFIKDIIAGHISSADVAKDSSYLGKIYHDKKSHYFIDGTVEKSRTIPVLTFYTDTHTYRY